MPDRDQRPHRARPAPRDQSRGAQRAPLAHDRARRSPSPTSSPSPSSAALEQVPALNATFVDADRREGHPRRRAPRPRRPRARRRRRAARRHEDALGPGREGRRHARLRVRSSSPTRTSSARCTPATAALDDFAGATVSVTNPGTLGTAQSVPRLMAGQGAIFGVGALGWPAGFEAADPRRLAPARRRQGAHAHLDLRPPHHPGRGVRRCSCATSTSASGASTASTTRSSRTSPCPSSPRAGAPTPRTVAEQGRASTSRSRSSGSRSSSTCTGSAAT